MRIKEGFEAKEVMGEYIIIRQGQKTNDQTQLISLNATALKLWNRFLGKAFSEEDVTQFLLDHYEVEAQVAANDAHLWVNNLIKCQLIDA